MKLEFKSEIRKLGKKKCGFIYLNKEHQNKFKIGQQLKVIIKLSHSNIIFFPKLRKETRKGVYVPASIIEKHNLLSKKAIITFEAIEGFFTKTSYDGRIYLPKQEAKKLSLKQNEIIAIEAIIEEKKYFEFCQVNIRKKPRTTEYFCMFNPKLAKKEGIFKIKVIVSRNNFKISKMIESLINGFNYAPLDRNKIILYHKHKFPIIIKTDFYIKDVAHYLGCFFADGTKKGNSWGVCASTFEQAKYFLEMHKKIIENPILNLELTYTDPFEEDKETLTKKLSATWLNKAKLNISKNKIWIYRTNTKDAQNRNIFGALSIREHRQLVLEYYNNLLDFLIKKIVQTKDKCLALDFILGVLEGDGSPSAKSRGHIVIATNQMERKVLDQIFRVLDFKHKGYNEDENKAYLRIGSIELIENILLIKDRIFKYYPKRRKRIISRLLATSTAKFLAGKQPTTSPLILKRFRDKRILTKENKLTRKGKEIKQAILQLGREIN